MYVMPVLPEELRLPLDKVLSTLVDDEGNRLVVCEYPGVTAVVRPLDLDTASKWNDTYPNVNARSVAATFLVFEQLIRIEGLTIGGADFDPKDKTHRRSMPMNMRTGIYLGIRDRATLEEELEKNSDSPSVSGGTGSGVSSPAEAVASA